MSQQVKYKQSSKRRGMVLGLVFAALVQSSTALAAEAPSWAKNWVKLLRLTIDRGQATKVQEQATFHLKKGTSFDVEQDRNIEYFTVVTTPDEEGEVTPNEAAIVKEQWRRLPSKNWEIRQDIFVFTLAAELKQRISQVVELNSDRIVVRAEMDESAPQNPLENFADQIQGWIEVAESLPVRIGAWNARQWSL
jgi:hypothetical protein